MGAHLQMYAGTYRRWCGIGLLALATAWFLVAWWHAPLIPDNNLPTQTFAHWKDASHDWLLLANPTSDELVVYDAANGHPLRRLGAADGLAGIDSIVQQGQWVFIVDRQHPPVRVLKLPQMQWVPLASL
ncbi:MAG: hypothetical protein WA777_06915 [Rhodanobacter sp.]